MTEGRLVIVGCGIELGRHINERTLSEIESADQSRCLTRNTLLWLSPPPVNEPDRDEEVLSRLSN